MATTKHTATATSATEISGGSGGKTCQVQGPSIYYRIEDSTGVSWSTTNGFVEARVTKKTPNPTFEIPADKFCVFVSAPDGAPSTVIARDPVIVEGASAASVQLPDTIIDINISATGTTFDERLRQASPTAATDDDDAVGHLFDKTNGRYWQTPSAVSKATLNDEGDFTSIVLDGNQLMAERVPLDSDPNGPDLGENFWIAGLAKGTTNRLFGTTSSFQGGLRALSNKWNWYNSAGSTAVLVDGDISAWHVFFIQRTGTTSIVGKYNKESPTTIVPYDSDGAGHRRGFVLFAQDIISPNNGLFTGSLAALKAGNGVITEAQKTAVIDELAEIGSLSI